MSKNKKNKQENPNMKSDEELDYIRKWQNGDIQPEDTIFGRGAFGDINA